ncbi:unnamed protein product [Orchesella dallaii]|uniref:C2H2-type domain-containing protein n=1 Tax=Orchesella dallaii TaxID=48710 RepID=A0ABP1PII7_9HEXA
MESTWVEVEEDEELIDTSLVGSFLSSTAWQAQVDPLSLTNVEEEVHKNHGEAVPSASSKTLRRGSRRRKRRREIDGDSDTGEDEEKESKALPQQEPPPLPAFLSKNVIKIIIPVVKDETVKEEVIIKNEENSPQVQVQNRDNLVPKSSSLIKKTAVVSKKKKWKSQSTVTGGSSQVEEDTPKRKRKKKCDLSESELARIRLRDRERVRRKRAMETPEEKEARRQRVRERVQKRRALLSEEERMRRRQVEAERMRRRRDILTKEEKQERSKKNREREVRKRLRDAASCLEMTPEELEEAKEAEFQHKMHKYLQRVAWKAKFTKEELREKEKWRTQVNYMRIAALPPEERRKRAEKLRAYNQALPLEKKREYYRRAGKKFYQKLRNDPNKMRTFTEKMKKFQREKTAKETPEERWKRLLRYKVYQAKRKAKIQLEKEGVLTAEEIERRLEEVVKQVEEKDRLEREKNPVDPADYQPREKARKPKKKSQQELPKMPFPLTSSTLQELPKPPQQKQTLLSVFKQVEQCQKIDAEAEPQAVIVTRHSESPPEEESPFVDNEEKDQVETEKKKKLEYQPRFLKARKPRRKNTARKSEEELTQIETCPSPSRPQQDPHPPQLECPAAPPCSRPSEESPQVRVEEEEESFHMDDEPDADDIEPNNEEEFASLASPSPASPPSPFSPSNSEDQLEEPQQQPTGIALEVETSSEVAVGLSEEISPHRGLDSKKIRKVEERIVCDECGKCLHPQSMKVHKHLFHNPLKVSSFKCPKCDKEFTSSHRLWDHYLNLHDEEKKPLAKKVSTYDGPFICEQCGKNYSQKANLEMHMKQVHLGERIICEVCGKEEQSQGKLWRHKITKHPQLKTPPPKGTIFCQYCSEPVLRSLPQHVKKFHPDKYEEFLQNDSAAALTVSKSNRDSKIKCVECDKEIRLDSVKRHMRNVHGHGSMAFPCQHCGKEFKENYHLNEHLRIVHSVDSFGNDSGAQIVRKENKGRKRKEFCIPCQHCGKEFKERYKLSEHIRLVHTIDSFDRKVDSMKLIKESKDEDGHTLLLCSLCDEKLFRRKEIGGHLLSTHLDVFEKLTKGGDDGISPSWKCVECVEDKEPCFGSEQLFYSHVKSCHPDKTKYCSQLNCYKLFSTQHSLRVHHSKEHSHAKFINPLCFEGGTLRRPRLRCDCCMTIFLRKPELMEHVKTLHPEAYWPCPHCELMFYTEQKLTETHLRSCRRNPEVRRPKKVVKGKRGRPKKIPKKTDETDEDEDGTASESEYLGIKDEKVAITGPSLATRTRNSSRIKAKRRKNRKVNSLKKHNMNDEKLKKEVKVLILRMTKEQIDYYSKARN